MGPDPRPGSAGAPGGLRAGPRSLLTRCSSPTSSSSSEDTASAARASGDGVVGGVVREDRVAMPVARPEEHGRQGRRGGGGRIRRGKGKGRARRSGPALRRSGRAPALEFLRDRLLAASPPDRRGRLRGDRVHRSRFRDGLARLRPRRDEGPRGRRPGKGSAHGQGPHGQAVPAALLPRGRPGRAQGRRQQRGRDGPLRRRVPRDQRPGHGREPGPGVRPAGERPSAAVHREAGRRRDGRLPLVRAGARRHGRLQGHGAGRGLLRRRAPAAAGPSGADAPRPIPVRDAQGGHPPRADVPRPGEEPTTRPGSTNSSSSPSMPSSSTASSRPFPTSSTIPTNARNRRSTASCPRAS